MEKLFTEIKDIVVAGKHTEVEALVEKAIAERWLKKPLPKGLI
jgi:hypothetical protein